MARWDAILSLPVQNPPTLEFSSSDIVWSKVEGWHDKLDRVALIPFARVDDFVRGESNNKECPTRFHVEARRRRPPSMPFKPKVDGILEYILYWCSFGPDDHRKGGIVRPSRTTYVPKKKNAGRPNTKRGCTCHFIVKRLIAEPSVALIIYNDDKHVDKKGLPCHGPQDKKAAGTRAMFAPYISEDLRLRVLSLLYVGVSVETIMQRHNESVERQGGPCNRDDLLTHRYVRRQERAIRRSTYELDADDAVSISMWVESHQNHVFFYEDFSDSDPFILGIQTEWQLQQMIRFGNRGLLASDSRFGTNKLKYPIQSLLVFNSDKKAIPVAWIITPRFSSFDANRWMRALYNRVHTKDPTWKLAGFIVDDPLYDVLAIRDVFQCSVLISFWRVRHLWHKNIMKYLETGMQIKISRQLGWIVDNICRLQGTMSLFEDFMEDFIDESNFMDYFKATWHPRLGAWTNALTTIPLASQESCAAMELYHNQLKIRLLNEKDINVYQRADWLVDKLGTKVHSYFWLDEYSGKDDFARYWKHEWMSGLTSWRKALKIPNTDVLMEDGCAKVTDQHDRDKAYVVWNPGSMLSICSCSWAQDGNLCEHILKVLSICRNRGSTLPSISLFQYHQALNNMLHCPPFDSLIRDHAVSLAVSVQKQLNTLLDKESVQTVVDPNEKRIIIDIHQESSRAVSATQDQDSVSERHAINDILSRDGDGCEDRSKAPGCAMSGIAGQVVDHRSIRNGKPFEIAGEDKLHADMDVDPSSNCVSSPGLYSVDESASSNAFSKKNEIGLTVTGDEISASKNGAV
ncbi:Zinc finger, SWIM-type [Sesbania bispinosa]|nr:Zinc finger, SWIM-type [Sesbania bispinosa]